MSTNTIVIECGRIGKDPELRHVGQNNTAMLTLSVCTSDSYKKGDEWVNEANWFECKFFGKNAEKIADLAVKGGEVYLRGHMKLETWNDGKSSKLVVMPDFGHVHIYPPRQREETKARRPNTDFPPLEDSDIQF